MDIFSTEGGAVLMLNPIPIVFLLIMVMITESDCKRKARA